MAALAAASAAICAANGVPFREPLKPMVPELAQEMVLPCGSVMVTMVLLNVDLMCATPLSTFFRSRRLVRVVPFRAAISCPPIIEHYFFLFATVRRGPLRVRALVFVRCPRTGKPLR